MAECPQKLSPSSWLAEGQRNVDQLLRSEISLADLPHRKSQSIRIYVSSPPEELVHERTEFAKNVYSRLNEYCWNSYGVECMVTDLKLVPEKDWDDPENIELCRGEIQRCRQSSIGPHLLVFCSEVSMKKVIHHLLSTIEHAFRSWYREYASSNTVRSKSSMGEETEDTTDSSDEEPILKDWHETKRNSTDLYSGSFDAEIEEGFDIGHWYGESCQCVIFTKDAKKFQRQIARKIKSEIKLLKCKGLNPPLQGETSSVISQASLIKWIPLSSEESVCMAKYHGHHNGAICGKSAYVLRSLERTIDECLNETNTDMDNSIGVLNHWYHAKKLTENTVLREEIQLIFDNYLQNTTQWPLVLVGGKASGKSTAIALLALNIQKKIQEYNAKGVFLILHFVGLTPESSNIREVLFSICSQMAHLLGWNSRQVPSDYSDLKCFFKDLLQRETSVGTYFVILVDNADHWSGYQKSEKFEWLLPLTIAANMKIIFTVNEISEMMRERIQNKTCGYVEISPLRAKEGGVIWKNWLELTNPNYDEMNAALTASQTCTKPGILKILLENILRFKPISFTDSDSVESIFCKLLTNIEELHGKDYVGTCLAFLSISSPMGLTEMELHLMAKTFFSFSDELESYKDNSFDCKIVYQWHCLFKDIKWFLVEYLIDGVQVLSVPAGHILNALQKQYFSDTSRIEKLEKILLNYFLSEHELKNAHQLFYFSIAQKWNVRKFNMIPHLLNRSSYRGEFKMRMLYNIEWLINKIRATTLENVLQDFSHHEDDEEVWLISQALQLSKSELQNNASYLCYELLGRLLPLSRRCPNIYNLLKQCDETILKHYYILPIWQLYDAPGGLLKKVQYQTTKQRNTEAVLDIFQVTTGDVLIAYRSSLGSATGLEMRNIRDELLWEEPNMPSKKFYHSRNGKYLIVFLSKDLLTIIQSKTGCIYGVVESGLKEVTGSCFAIGEQFIALTSSKGVGPIIIDIENCKMVHRMECYVQAMSFSKNEDHFVVYMNNRLILFSIPCFQRKASVETEEIPSKLLLSIDCKKCLSLSQTGVVSMICFKWNRHESSIQEVFYHVDLQELIMSATGDLSLFLASKKLFLLQIQKLNKVSILTFPPKMFIEKMSHFVSANFSACGGFVIAIRWIYIGIWNTQSGEIIRVLKTIDNAPFKRLFISKCNSEFYTLSNHTLEVWDLKYIYSEIQFKPKVFPGEIKDLAITTNGKKVICCANKSFEAKIIDVETGLVCSSVSHGQSSLNEVTSVDISPDGQYALTFAHRRKFLCHDFNGSRCNFLKECIVWDIRTPRPRKLHHFGSCRFVIFSKTSELISVVYCVAENLKMYNGYGLMLNFQKDQQEDYIDLPAKSEFIGKPCAITMQISTERKSIFAAILQKYIPTKTTILRYSTVLYVISLIETQACDNTEKNIQEFDVKYIWQSAKTMTQFLDMVVTNDEKLLLLFAKSVLKYDLNTENGIQLPENCEKAAAIFDVFKRETLMLLEDFHLPDNLHIIDRFCSEDILMNLQQIILSSKVASSQLKQYLVTNGCWSVCLSENQKYLLVVNLAENGRSVTRVPVHGRAGKVGVAGDGRTLAVGCTDGRLLLFMLTCGNSDQQMDTLPSRTKGRAMDAEALLKLDISRADVERQNQLRLSAKFRKEKLKEFYRPQSSRKLSANAQFFNGLYLLH